jgi:hypothetical protein
VVPPIGIPLLAGSTAPRAATLELVPSSLDATPPGVASTTPRRVAPAVPPSFVPRAAPTTNAAPRAASATPAAPRAAPAAPATAASLAQHPGHPPAHGCCLLH